MARILAYVAVVLLSALVMYIRQPRSVYPPLFQQVPGKNNTALFLVNMLGGLHNVHMATIQSLVENYPHLELHVASWDPVGAKVKHVAGSTGVNQVEFHALTNQSYYEAIFLNTGALKMEDFIHPPGAAAAPIFGGIMQGWMSPWLGPDYLALVNEMGALIEQIDPAVVVLDALLWPAINAAREKNRVHALIVPNTVMDTLSFLQPWASFFWKYPPLGSRLTFPIPWAQIPENIWHSLQLWYQLGWTPNLRKTEAYLRGHGMKSSYGDFYHLHRPDAPWITQELAEASIPVDILPQNVTRTGPINIRVASAAEQDPELATWLAQGPTILVNLGGSIEYNEQRATAMTQALNSVLNANPGFQAMWKYKMSGEYPDDFKAIAKKHIDLGRLRIVPWLDVDPFAILETGHITAFVHHGGAGSYHEGLTAGVPHVALPLWGDHFNFATLVEYLEMGVWACRETTPEWTAECLTDAISSVIDDSKKSKAIRQNAERLGDIARRSPGRDGAARIIAELAASGYA